MRRLLFLSLLLGVAGCAGRPAKVAIEKAPPPVPVQTAALPAGATPGMLVPAALADGSFPTPNRGLSAAGTLWHLRAGLNVAALSCQGEAEGGAIVTGYNAMLARDRAALAAAEAGYAAEWQAGGGAWRDRYDDAMTRLYNFFSQTPARGGFCRAAGAVLAELETAPAMDAAPALAVLDRPFTTFYAAYDAWRRGQALPGPAPVIAMVASVPPRAAAAPVKPRARLELDPAVFGVPEE